MSTLSMLLILIAATIILVFIHELGHFIFAKINGVYVAEFSIGFGPKIFSYKYKDTWYSIRALPLGGYVSILTNSTIEKIEEVKLMLAKNPDSLEEIKEGIFPYDLDKDYSQYKSYEKSSFTAKALIILSGVSFNLIFSVIILSSSYANIGVEVKSEDIHFKTYNYEWDSSTTDLSYSNLLMQNSFVHFVTTDDALKNEIDSLLMSGTYEYDSISEYCKTDCYYGYEEINEVIDIEVDSETTYNMYFSPSYNFSYDYLFYMIENSTLSKEEVTDLYELLSTLPEGEKSQYELLYEILIEGYSISGDTEFMTYQSILDDTNEDGDLYKYVDTDKYVENTSTRKNQFWYSASISVETGKSLQDSFHSTSRTREISSYVSLYGWENFSSAIVDSFTNMINPWVDIFSEQNPSITYVDENYIGDNGQTNSRYGYAQFNNILAILSSMLILFNIIPIPPLDGYKFAESVYEKGSGKNISSQTKAKLDRIGWIVISAITLMLFFIPLFIF